MAGYVGMCRAFAMNVGFTELSPVAAPQGSPFDADRLAAVVQAAAPKMPADYATSYAAPLARQLPALTRKLKAQQDAGADADFIRSRVDTLVGAVRDWTEPDYLPALKRFEAVISNLFRSFLSEEQRGEAGLPLIQVVPPLATFAQRPDSGPFTIEADEAMDLIQVPIGVVSLPGSYRAHPLLWPTLAHECGGHDVLHATPGLLEELAAGVAGLPGVEPEVAQLWAGWIDEAAADVYGLLNMGPAFAMSMAAFVSTLRASSTASGGALGPVSNVLVLSGGKPFDTHPVDLLRVHLAIGVTAQLAKLSAATKTGWLAQLEDLAAAAAGGATTIDAADKDSGQVVRRMQLGPMAEAARTVGGYIATARLKALEGHAIQEIETWDDADEQAAEVIRKVAGAGASVVGLGDDAQLLAGATMALFDGKAGYGGITPLLEAALDDSYAHDPVFMAPPAA